MRRLLGGAAVISLVACLFPLFPPAASAAVAGAAVREYGSCLDGNKRGDLMLLFDESGSLQSSDPEAGRVAAANELLASLATFTEDSGVKLDIGIAGFSSDFQLEGDWTELSKGSLPDLKDRIDQFRNHNTGDDTDYLNALDGARAALSARPEPTDGRTPCRAIAWFSDGKIDFTPAAGKTRSYAPGLVLDSDANVREAADLAAKEICREGGTADALRANSILMFSVGLAAKTSSPGDFDTMSSISTGDRPVACGAPTDKPVGEFYPASNVADMILAFDAFSTPGQPPTTKDTGVCVVTDCPEGMHDFVLDNSIGKARVVATADVPGAVPNLISPSGERLVMTAPSGDTTLSGVPVKFQNAGNSVTTFTMTNGAGTAGWSGLWSLVYITQDRNAVGHARSSIHVTGDLQGHWKNQDAAGKRVGEDLPVQIELVNGDHNVIPVSSLSGQVLMTVRVKDSTGKVKVVAENVPKERIGEPISASLADLTAGPASLVIELKVTTAGTNDRTGQPVPGTTLELAPTEQPFQIGPQRGYPAISPRVNFGKLEGVGSTDATVKVTGPGCVWLPSDTAFKLSSNPTDLGKISITSSANSAQNCIAVRDGESGELSLKLSSDREVNGGLAGEIPLSVAPLDDHSAIKQVPLSFTANLMKPLSTTSFLVALIVGLILGPGIPLLLLYLAKWFTARIPARPLRAQRFDVTIANGQVLRNNAPFALGDRDLIQYVTGLESPARRIFADGVQLSTRVGLSPAGAGFVVAETPGMLGASTGAPGSHGKPAQARLPLAIHNNWIVLVDQNVPDRAQILVLLSGDAGPTVRDSLAADVNAKAPALAERLRASNVPTDSPVAPPPAGGHDPFGVSGAPAQPVRDPFGMGGFTPPPAAPPGGAGQPPPNPWGTGTAPAPRTDPFGGGQPTQRNDPFGGPPPGAGFDPFGGPQR